MLYWVVLKNKVVGPNDPPVKKTREHSAAKQLSPNRDVTTCFPGVHSVDVDGVELPSPLLAEAQLIDGGISALVYQGKKKTHAAAAITLPAHL